MPPAFHFAGAEVLPGSGLGNRSAVDRGTRSVQTPSVPLSTGGTTLSAAPVQWASRPAVGTVARSCCISPGRSARPASTFQAMPAVLPLSHADGYAVFKVRCGI